MGETPFTPAAALYPDPKILYDPDPEITPSILVEHGSFPAGATLGMACHAWYNYARKRPLYASFPVYIAIGLGFGTIFYCINLGLKKYYSRRDTIHKHYIMLHPEDFPPPPKIKIADMIEDWKPVR